MLALVRSLRAPWFAPFRLMVVIYIDIFAAPPSCCWCCCSVSHPGPEPARPAQQRPCSGALVAMILSYLAYVAEIYRSGIDAVHEGQWAAGQVAGAD